MYLLEDFNINTLIGLRNIFKTNKATLKGDKQLIEEPTRITETNASIIDHVLTNCCDKVSQKGVINIGLSDNQMIFCIRKLKKHKFNKHRQVKFRSFKNYTKELYWGILRDTHFPNYSEFNDIDLAYSDFQNRLSPVINSVAPIREARVKCISQDWFDGEIAESIETRDKLFKKYKKSKLQVDSDLWKEAKNRVQNLIKKKKKEYYENKILENTGKPKELWKALKSMGIENKKDPGLNFCLKEEESLHFETRSKLEIFKKFYSGPADNLLQ